MWSAVRAGICSQRRDMCQVGVGVVLIVPRYLLLILDRKLDGGGHPVGIKKHLTSTGQP